MPVPASVEAEFDQWLDTYADAWAGELRAELGGGDPLRECGGKGSGKPGPCPTAGSETDAHAGKLAAMADKLKGAAAATVAKIIDFAVKKYTDLETQFGRKGAIAILGASVALSAVPLPGTSLVPIALAKGYMAVKARWSGGESMEEAKGTCGVGQNPGRDKCLDGSFS